MAHAVCSIRERIALFSNVLSSQADGFYTRLSTFSGTLKTQNAAARFAETLRHNPEGQAGHSYARKAPDSVHPGTIRSGSVHRRSRVREQSRGVTSPITAVDNAIDRANASSGSSVDAGSLQPNVGT